MKNNEGRVVLWAIGVAAYWQLFVGPLVFLLLFMHAYLRPSFWHCALILGLAVGLGLWMIIKFGNAISDEDEAEDGENGCEHES